MTLVSESTATVPAEPTGLGSEIVAGLIGAGVAMGCVLPPIIHLVAGPLGPFIGGFVAANKVRIGPRAQLIIAVTVGTVLAGFIGGVLSIAAHLASASELPSWFPSTPPKIAAIAAVVWVYGVVLSAVGTVVRGAVGRK